MDKEKGRNKVTKTLAAAGTILVLGPIAFAVLTSAIGTIVTGKFHFDYLMPAELFPVAFAGALLLFWAAKQSGLHFRFIGFNLVLLLFFMGTIIVIPSVTGLASGETEPAGAPFLIVMSCLVLYTISLISAGVNGIRLWRDLYREAA